MKSNFENAVSSPVLDYGYQSLMIIGFIVLLWFSFTKSGKEFLGNIADGLGDAVTVTFCLTSLWFLFLFSVALFSGLIGSFLP